MKTANWTGKFGLLAAATSAIDRQWKFSAELGERYIRVNLQTRREEQTRTALERMGMEDTMREELREAGAQLLTHYKNTTLEPPRLSKSFRDRVLDIAEVTAVLRTHVIRDNNHDIPIMPEPEVGTRLGKQMLKLAQAAAFLYEKTEPGDFEHSLLLRAAIDALQPRRLRVLKALIEGASTLNEVNKSTSVPRQTLKYELENLALLRAVTEVGDGKEWILNENVGSKLKQTGLAEIITRDLPPKDS